LIEAAFAVPLLVALLYAILIYGSWFMAAHMLQQAANDAARTAVERGLLSSVRTAPGVGSVTAVHCIARGTGGRRWTCRLAGDRPQTVTWVGVLAGFVGLAVLLLGGRSVPGFPLWPSVLVVASAGCWAVGSFLQPRLQLPENTFATTAYQLLAGGLVLTLAGVLAGEQWTFHLPLGTWLVLAYLTLASVAAYTTFVWLLAHAPISLVSTHAYVNPVVAVLLGWVWLSEPITWPVVVGGAVVLVAVGLVMAERRRSRDESRDDPREEPPVS